jgi:predicted NBD/HSP70 family sugar kinase
MKPNQPILGIDVGASKINAILWHKNHIIKQQKSTNVTKKELRRIINDFSVSKIGIGFPGIVDRSKNQIIYCPSAPQLNNFDINELGSGQIRIDNDVNCMLRAEITLGAAQGLKNILCLAFGTGIDGAILINNKNYEGHAGSAGEFGWMILDNKKTWEYLYKQTRNNPERQLQINIQGISNLINVFNPEIIIIGGGAQITIPKRNQILPYINSPLAQKTKIIRTKLGTNTQAIGAALLH